MEKFTKSDLWNYVFKCFIILLCIYLYYIGSITINRIIIFFIVFGLIVVYSRFLYYIDYVFKKDKVKNYIKNNEIRFYKILDKLLVWQKWHNPFIPFLTYTDKCLFQLNRYITGTKLLHYNFVVYVVVKYLLMFGLLKLILYKYYYLWYKFYNLTIIDILLNRMYGLILSVLIFTDIINNIILYVSHYGYGIWSYIIIYYIISILFIIGELIWFTPLINYLGFLIKKFKLYWLMYFYFVRYTKMNIVIGYRNDFTWAGQIILNIISILIPEKKTFHEEWMSVEEFANGSGFVSGRIAYFKPLEKTLSFEYFQYFNGFMDHWFIIPSFQVFYESYKYDLPYNEFFKLKYERKYKPSPFLYWKLHKLASIYKIYNQPIGKLMDWTYFGLKANESVNIFNGNETLIVNCNLQYLKKVDDLRAKLLYNIMWDIEYYFTNNKEYNWNYWIIQYQSILEVLIFIIDYNIFKNIDFEYNDNKLKFYDPEENMEYLNRLFNVLGNEGYMDLDISDNYYVSQKFNNYNKNYV